jgi:FMN phosphatase YigB (HAD superfamily)
MNTRLESCFDTIIISEEVGFSKPDKRIFELALHKLNVQPEDALFVGDDLEKDIAEKLAEQIGQEVLVYEDLKERIFSSDDNRVSDKELVPLLKKSFGDSNFAPEGGESNSDCQKRTITL